MTQEEKGTRFTYWHALDYRPAHVKEKEVLPTPNWDQNQFGKHLDDFKELIYQLAVPFINSHFATEFNKEFSHVKVNGRTIRSINDLVEFIHTYDPTCKKSGNPPLKQVRKMVYFAMYGNWGKSHYWAEAGELKTLAMLGMTYNGNKMASGKVQIRKQRGGGIKAHFVKKLDMERNKINDAWARVRLERFFKRDVYKPPTPKETEQDQQRSKNPRADKSHLRKYLVFCKIAQGDAFDGAYLLLEGHPERAKIDRKESGTVSMASTSEESQSENSSEASLISEVAAGLQGKEAEDFSTILKALQETKGQGGALQALSALLKGRKRERLEEQTATQAGPPPASKKPRVAAPGTPAPSVVTMKSNTSTVSDVTAEDPEAASNLLKLPVGELDHLENFNGDTEIMEEAAGGKFFDVSTLFLLFFLNLRGRSLMCAFTI